MYDVQLTGLGVSIEDAHRPLWCELARVLREGGRDNWLASRAQAEASELVPVKERRILSPDDVMGIATADLALRDANTQWVDDAACIVVNTGKHTVDGERGTYRRQFMTAESQLDAVAMATAIELGQAQVNPFSLLRTLDNNVLWWLCRYRQFGAINLQITQRTTPSFFGLWEAVELVREGSAMQVLVGGTQLIDQASVDLSHETGGFVSAADETVGGGSLFFVLERGASGRERGGYGQLTLHEPSDPCPAPIVYDQDVGRDDGGRAPGLASFVCLLEAVLHARPVLISEGSLVARRIGFTPREQTR